MPRVRLNRAGMRELLNDPGLARDLHRRMEPVLAEAKAAPDVTGAYEASLIIRDEKTDRVVSRVYADVDYALAVEASRGTLARALGRAGR